MKLTDKDLKKLDRAHPDLKKFVLTAAKKTTIPFMVMEVSRDLKTQQANVKKGVSKTLRSRHLPSKDGLARAADLVPVDEKGRPIWAWPLYHKLAVIMKAAARECGVPIEWGGDWKKFKDGPHWQLPWKLYP